MRIPGALNLASIQAAFKEIWREIQPWLTANVDLKGRRITNAAQAVGPKDYITLFQADERYASAAKLVEFTRKQTEAVTTIRFDTFANRGSASQHSKSLFVATDRNMVTWGSDGTVWTYLAGMHSSVQSGIAAITATLGSDDAGYRIDVTDFEHVLRWNGTTLDFAPEDDGSHYYKFATEAPVHGVWYVPDGNATTYLTGSGTTQAVTPVDTQQMLLVYYRR